MDDRPVGDQEPFEHLAAGHRKMAGLQKDFNRRLMKKVERLELELKEVMTRRRQVESEKIETGNRLYSAQQQLAQSQMNYEKTHQNFNIIQKLRIQSEQKLQQINEAYNFKKANVVTRKGQVTKSQKELESLMRHYHEIESYNLQLKSDIAVTRTQTFTAEQAVANLEKVKKKQDLLIDSMNEEIKRLEEQKNILAAQLVTQKQETEEARKVLKDAQFEMGNIVASKKNLLDRWQKSLTVMQKMDETLEKQNIVFREQKEALILITTEYNGIKSQIRKEDAKTEKIATHASRLSNEKGSLEMKQRELKNSQENILMQLSVLKSSLNNTEQEIKKVETERKQVDEEMNLIETNIMKLHTQTKKLLEGLVNQKGEHTAIEKTASNLLKQANTTALDIQEKEVELENLLNQIARVKIDQLNTKSQIEILDAKKGEVIKERVEKQVQVATYEIQIREGHDLNEKKQHQVGRLNKLHDYLVSSANDQSKSPLENKHQNLLRETEQLQGNCNELYRDWIKKQTVLVHNNNRLQEMSEVVSGLQTKKTILEQKKARLNADHNGTLREIASIKTSLKGLQNNMHKLNNGLADRGTKKQKLQNENFNIESEFGEKLKELEGDSVRLQTGIDRLREQKADLLNQIIECEKHILLWERKYQLEKEMQDALDPNVGQAEIEELKKEIHRMDLKYQSIEKAQNQTQVELLRASRKQQSIEDKYAKRPSSKNRESSKEPSNKNQFQQVMKDYKSKYIKATKNIQDLTERIRRKKQEKAEMNEVISSSQQQFSYLANETNSLEMDILLTKTQKQVEALKIATTKASYKKISDMINNQKTRPEFQEAILRQKLTELKEKNYIICQCIDEVASKYPQYQQILSQIASTRNISPILP